MKNFVKSTSSFLLFAAVAMGQSNAQAPAPAGQSSFALVNALSGTGNLFISFDGAPIWAPGFTPGQSTGAVIFPSGSKQAEASCQGFATTKFRLDLQPGKNHVAVFYPGPKVAEGPDAGKRGIGIFLPPALNSKSRLDKENWRLLLVGHSQPLTVSVNGKPVSLTPEKSVTVQLGGKPGIDVKLGEKLLLQSAAEEPGDYWVVIYPGTEPGAFAAVLLMHLPLPLP